MADAAKIEPCDCCGGAGGLDVLTVNGQTRYRVRCASQRCGHMTVHFSASCLALAVWNERTGQREDKLAG